MGKEISKRSRKYIDINYVVKISREHVEIVAVILAATSSDFRVIS